MNYIIRFSTWSGSSRIPEAWMGASWLGFLMRLPCWHRIRVCYRVEGTSGRPLIPSSFKAGPALKLDEVMQGLVKFSVSPRNSKPTASLGPWSSVWLLSWWKTFSSKQITIAITTCGCCQLPFHCVPLRKVWLQCRYRSFLRRRRLNRSLLSLLQASSPPWTCPSLSMCLLYWEAITGHGIPDVASWALSTEE